MPTDSDDCDLDERGAGEEGTGARGAVSPGRDDHVQGGLYTLDPEIVDPDEPTQLPASELPDPRDATFGGDTFDGNTRVRTPVGSPSLLVTYRS